MEHTIDCAAHSSPGLIVSVGLAPKKLITFHQKGLHFLSKKTNGIVGLGERIIIFYFLNLELDFLSIL